MFSINADDNYSQRYISRIWEGYFVVLSCQFQFVISYPDSLFLLVFVQHFIGLEERTLHDSFSENDIKVDFMVDLMKFDLKPTNGYLFVRALP
jgi:hypothetical protein